MAFGGDGESEAVKRHSVPAAFHPTARNRRHRSPHAAARPGIPQHTATQGALIALGCLPPLSTRPQCRAVSTVPALAVGPAFGPCRTSPAHSVSSKPTCSRDGKGPSTPQQCARAVCPRSPHVHLGPVCRKSRFSCGHQVRTGPALRRSPWTGDSDVPPWLLPFLAPRLHFCNDWTVSLTVHINQKRFLQQFLGAGASGPGGPGCPLCMSAHPRRWPGAVRPAPTQLLPRSEPGRTAAADWLDEEGSLLGTQFGHRDYS